MRTGRALTVSVGGGASQKDFLGGKEIEKKGKKNLENPTPHPNPENFRHPPRKFQTPPQNFNPPQKTSDTPPGTRPGTPPPRGQTHACKLITLAQLRCGR